MDAAADARLIASEDAVVGTDVEVLWVRRVMEIITRTYSLDELSLHTQAYLIGALDKVLPGIADELVRDSFDVFLQSFIGASNHLCNAYTWSLAEAAKEAAVVEQDAILNPSIERAQRLDTLADSSAPSLSSI